MSLSLASKTMLPSCCRQSSYDGQHQICNFGCLWYLYFPALVQDSLVGLDLYVAKAGWRTARTHDSALSSVTAATFALCVA